MKDCIPQDAGSARSDEFTATHWSQVALAAEQDGSVAARDALERLCARYWSSIYGFLRRQGKTPADAEDLTQGFFARLLADHSLIRAERSKGRFRNFLLGALKRFLVDVYRQTGAGKRGRHKTVLAMDFAEVERSYLDCADPELTPEQAFDRRWAATVLEAAFAALEAEFRAEGESARFEQLKRFLTEEGSDEAYATVGACLGLSPKSVSSAVCRLRDRFRETVQEIVLSTVASPEDIDPELQELFR